jgi:HTH-type transcriptional regulator / antitoxin HigA
MIKPIKSDSDYSSGLKRIYELMHKELSLAESDELEVLGVLIENYEEEHFPIGPPHPIEAIKFKMEQMGIDETGLAKLLGNKSLASDLLSGKRKLNLRLMKILHQKLGVSAEALLAD